MIFRRRRKIQQFPYCRRWWQQENGDLSATIARNWILLTIWLTDLIKDIQVEISNSKLDFRFHSLWLSSWSSTEKFYSIHKSDYHRSISFPSLSRWAPAVLTSLFFLEHANLFRLSAFALGIPPCRVNLPQIFVWLTLLHYLGPIQIPPQTQGKVGGSLLSH